MNWAALGLGALLAGLIAGAAWQLGALTGSGMLAAALIGTLTFAFGGFRMAVLLVAFFVSSSLLTRLGNSGKATLAGVAAKGGRRDAGQVLANGGLAALSALVYAASDSAAWLVIGAASLAVATADTWATEVGILAGGSPRLITTFRRVEAGTSGAISMVGTAAALAGALTMGLLTWWMTTEAGRGFAAGLAGMLGSLVDSLLGATVQAQFACQVCGKTTEAHPRHGCGGETVHRSGWKWLDNDWVNFLSALAGCVAAGAILFG